MMWAWNRCRRLIRIALAAAPNLRSSLLSLESTGIGAAKISSFAERSDRNVESRLGGAIIVSGLLHSFLILAIALALREPSTEMQAPEPIPIEIVMLDPAELQPEPPGEQEPDIQFAQKTEESSLAALDKVKTPLELPIDRKDSVATPNSEAVDPDATALALPSAPDSFVAKPEVTPVNSYKVSSTQEALASEDQELSETPPRTEDANSDRRTPEGTRLAASTKRTDARSAVRDDTAPSVTEHDPRDLVLRVQTKLKAAGFDPGPLDGEMGPRTRAAISALFVSDQEFFDLGPLALLDMPPPGSEASNRRSGHSGESVIETFPFRAAATSAGQPGDNDAGATSAGKPTIATGLPAGLVESLPQECRGTPSPVSLSSGEIVPPDPFAPGYFEYFLAQDAQNRGASAQAAEIYGKAIESGLLSDDYLAFAYNNRGAALKRVGREERAIADYDRALALRPGYAPAHYNRGLARQDRGQNERALADYSAAIRYDPRHAHAYHNRGIAHDALGKTDRALADLNRAIEIAPCLDYAYFNRGRLLEARGERERAHSDFEMAYGLQPDNPLYKDKFSRLSAAD